MVSPASVGARPRPDLRKIGVAACSSSFFNCALTAEVERPSRSAALAKLPSSMPVTKLLRTSRSKVTRRMETILFFGSNCQKLPDIQDEVMAIETRRQDPERVITGARHVDCRRKL